MNIPLIQHAITLKSNKPPLNRDDDELSSLRDLLEHKEVAEYLRNCTPSETFEASGVSVLPINAIVDEMVQGAAPGSYIRPFGYVVVATSIGGNTICFHGPTARVFWADHTSFKPNSISYQDRNTGTWKYLYEYTPDNVMQALVLLNDNIESFLNELLSDRIAAKLDALDLG